MPATTLALALEAGLDVGTRCVGDVLVVSTVGAPRRGRIAEPQIEIDAIKHRFVLEPAAHAWRHQMRTFFDARAIDNRDRGVSQRSDDVGIAVDLLGAVADL